MRVLFFYIGTPSPILEIELELIKNHEKAGHIVNVVQCAGNLPNCHWNLAHDDSKCRVCRSKFKHSWDVLNPGDNVSLKQFDPVNLQRELTLPETFESMSHISSVKYDDENIGFGTTATIVSLAQDHRPDLQSHSADINRTLRTSVEVYDRLKREILQFEPDCVYFFNGRIATHLPAKLLCKKLSLDFYCYEAGNIDGHYCLLKNETVHQPMSADAYGLLMESWNSELQAEGEARLNMMRYGDPSGKLKTFSKNHRINVLPEGFDKEKRNIVIFNGTLDEYEGVEWGCNKIYKPDQTAGVVSILKAMQSDNDFFFYFRVHPNMKNLPRTTSQLKDIEDLSAQFSNVCVIWPEENIDSYCLLEHCEKTITFGSSTGLEATYWGKPSILADYSLFDAFDYAYRPDSHEDLLTLLRQQNLQPKSPDVVAMALYSVGPPRHTPFKYVEESSGNNNVRISMFDGVRIQANPYVRLWHWLYNIPMRFQRILRQPSLIYDKYKSLTRQ